MPGSSARASRLFCPVLLCCVVTCSCSLGRLSGIGAAYGIYGVIADDGPPTKFGHGPSIVLRSVDEANDDIWSLEFALAGLPLEQGGEDASYFRMMMKSHCLHDEDARASPRGVCPRLWGGAGFERISFTSPGPDVMGSTLGVGIGLQGSPARPLLWYVELSGSVWFPWWAIFGGNSSDPSGLIHWGASVAINAGFEWSF